MAPTFDQRLEHRREAADGQPDRHKARRSRRFPARFATSCCTMCATRTSTFSPTSPRARPDCLARDRRPAHPIPAFMISEIRRGFEIGVLIVLPFLVIDLIVATVTMAMGMMMPPPTVVSLPFKILFFVLIDGWNLLVGSP
ncbi:hypothetical protein ACVOMV_00115 [Mesorhizobium atlanticum]